MITEIIPIPLYFGKLTLIKAENFEEVNKKYNTSARDGEHASVAFRYEDDNYVIVIISAEDLSVLAHEVVHIVNYIFKDVGIKLDLDNDEPQAYLHGWIFSQVLEFIKNQTL